MKRKVRVTLIFTTVILLVMLLVGMRSEQKPIVSLRGATAIEQDIYSTVFAPGRIEATKSVDMTTARTATVVELLVQTGDSVTKGQPLLRIRESQMTLSEESAQTFAREMMKGNIADQDAIATALQDMDTPSTEEEHTITAPMSGTVMSIPARVGQNLLPGISYLTVSDLSQLQVCADIPETYVGSVRQKQNANITIDADPDKIVAAKVRAVAPYARRTMNLTGQDEAATVEAILDLKDADTVWKPGYSVNVKIFTDAVADAVLVPYEAIMQEGTREFVYIVDSDGYAHKKFVETGYELDGYIQIKSGMEPGQVVLLSPPDILNDGDLVEVTGI